MQAFARMHSKFLTTARPLTICAALACSTLFCVGNVNGQPRSSQVVPATVGPACTSCGTCVASYQPVGQPHVMTSGLCKACTVAVDCADNVGRRQGWKDLHPYNFQPLAHGEYLGPIRIPATTDYQLRIGDQIRFTYILSRNVLSNSYILRPGDKLEISSLTDETLKQGDLNTSQGAEIQPDGNLTLKMIGEVKAAGLTIAQLRRNLEVAYKDQILTPAIDVIPVKTNTQLLDIYNAVDNTAGIGGHALVETVHADATVRLPKLGSVRVGGMTLDEIKREINLRYRQIVPGLEVEPIIAQEATHSIYVLGQVTQPGRFQLQGPTTVLGALALAQGTLQGANARQIVIFRRAEDWRLIATRIDLNGAILGKSALPADDIWLRDNDIIIVPPTPIERVDVFVRQWFTEGIYSVLPFAQIGAGFDVGAGVGGQ